MILRRVLPVLMVASAALLSGCAEEEPPVIEGAATRPVKTLLIEAPDAATHRQFPGRVTAAKRATLSFQINGELKALNAQEGLEVKAGDVLARLDDKDLKISVRERDASFKKARADFQRAKELVGKGHISRREYDSLEATLASARASLDQARNTLSHAVLKAPFAGSVTRRLVNDFEQVTAKQPILELYDLTTLEIKFDVPEVLVQRVQPRTPEGAKEVTRGRVFASFESLPGQQYPLEFKEAAGQADPDTQTFEVSFTMPTPENLQILPGMSATVITNLEGIVDQEAPKILVPAQAVVADAGMQPRVWIVETNSMTLTQRPVTVGAMQGTQIQVLEGLKTGDRIVVAGVAYLESGMPVSLIPETEQADPASTQR